MQPPLCCKAHAVNPMMQTTTLDDEDQMGQALAELRADRSEDSVDAMPDTTAFKQVDETPVAPPEPAPIADAPAPTDPTAQLKQAQADLHKARSEIGRVDALNRKYMQAAQEAAQLREELAQVRQTQAPPASASDAVSKLALVADQVKDFPELAGIVAAVSDALKQSDEKTEGIARRVAAQVVEPLEPLRREQSSRAQIEQQAAYDAAMSSFNSTYPTAVQVVQSDEFKSWLSHQPGHIQYAFEKGQTPAEAMTVLDTFDMHLRRTGQTPVAQFNPTQDAAPAASARNNPNRLQRAAGLPSRASGPQGGQPPADDFDASLAYFRSKRLKAQQLAA